MFLYLIATFEIKLNVLTRKHTHTHISMYEYKPCDKCVYMLIFSEGNKTIIFHYLLVTLMYLFQYWTGSGFL